MDFEHLRSSGIGAVFAPVLELCKAEKSAPRSRSIVCEAQRIAFEH